MWFWSSWTLITYLQKLHRFWNFPWYMEQVSYQSNIQKNDKRIINNYGPVSLLSVCGKILERIMYNPVFLYLKNNELLTPHQSGFRPNDSCIYQLISIVHHIYANFDHNKLVVIFWISQKRLIKYGTKDCYTNLNFLVYQETF